jgi:hypothetical protein
MTERPCPPWLARTEAETVLDAVRRLVFVSALATDRSETLVRKWQPQMAWFLSRRRFVSSAHAGRCQGARVGYPAVLVMISPVSGSAPARGLSVTS